MDRNIIRNVLAIFSSKVGVLLLTIIVTPLLVRLLGSEGYGDYAFIFSSLQWVLVLVYAGSFNGIRKYISEERSIEGWASSVYSFYLRVVFSIATVVIIAILIFARSNLVVSMFGKEFVLYFYIVALLIPFRVLFRTSRSTLMGFNLEPYVEPLQVVNKIIFGMFVVMFFYFGGNVATVLIGKTIACAITALLALVLVARYIPLSDLVTSTPQFLPRRQLLTYSVSTMILSFLMASMYQLDVILLRTMVGSAETGYYKAALVIAEFLWFTPIAVQIALLHSTSQLWVEEKYDQLTNISTRATRYTLLLTLLLILGIAGLARPFITIYFGPDFESAVLPLLLLLPGVLGFAVARPVIAISQGQDHLRILILATAASALLNFVLNLVLIPLYGMNGAAVATSTAYGSMVLFHVLSAQRLGFNPIADLRLGRIVLLTMTAGIPIIGLPSYVSSDIISLVVIPIPSLILYSILAFKTGAIDRYEIQDLVSNSPISIDRFIPYLPFKWHTK